MKVHELMSGSIVTIGRSNSCLVISSPVLSVESDDDLVEAARVMLEDKVGSLPVLEQGRVVGIVTEPDALRQIGRADRSCSSDVADIGVSYP